MSDTAIEVVSRTINNLRADAEKVAKKFGESEEDYQKRLKEMGDSVGESFDRSRLPDGLSRAFDLEAYFAGRQMLTPGRSRHHVRDQRASLGGQHVLTTVAVDGKIDENKGEVVDGGIGDDRPGVGRWMVQVSFDTLTAGVVPGGIFRFRPAGARVSRFAPAPECGERRNSTTTMTRSWLTLGRRLLDFFSPELTRIILLAPAKRTMAIAAVNAFYSEHRYRTSVPGSPSGSDATVCIAGLCRSALPEFLSFRSRCIAGHAVRQGHGPRRYARGVSRCLARRFSLASRLRMQRIFRAN